MAGQTPELDGDRGRSGLLETIAARFAAEDAARAAWLDARLGTGRKQPGSFPAPRLQTICAECGLKSGHHPGCTERGRRAPVVSAPATTADATH